MHDTLAVDIMDGHGHSSKGDAIYYQALHSTVILHGLELAIIIPDSTEDAFGKMRSENEVRLISLYVGNKIAHFSYI